MNNSNWLYTFRNQVASQNGEDGIIQKIFELLPPKNKWCVEFGAGDGYNLSNTWNLIVNKGWQSIQIERHPEWFSKLKKTYEQYSVTCLDNSVGFTPSYLLDEILSLYPIPKNFDFLSIDVDNFDYQIWKAVTVYRPSVVCIEFCLVAVINVNAFLFYPNTFTCLIWTIVIFLTIERSYLRTKGYEKGFYNGHNRAGWVLSG